MSKSAYQIACETLEELRIHLDKVIQEKRKEIELQNFNHLVSIYQTAYLEITSGINLQMWKEDIEAAIIDVNVKIENHGGPTPFLDTVKNDLYYLKYLIAEST